MSSNVTRIGDWAFCECTSLENVALPDCLTSIGYAAFEKCESFTSITVPKGITEISESAFDGCKNVTIAKIPDSVTTINNYAFHGCDKLTEITIPESVTVIGAYAFGHYEEYKDDETISHKVDGFTVYGYEGTAAEAYAKEYEFAFAEPKEVTLDVTLNIKESELNDKKFTMTVDGGTAVESENASVALPDMADGKHVLKFESENFVAREYEVTVQHGEIVDLPEIELNLIGDINGDGEIKATDLLIDKSHIKGVGVLTGYELKCADIDGNGKVNATDLLKLKAHIKGVSKLW